MEASTADPPRPADVADPGPVPEGGPPRRARDALRSVTRRQAAAALALAAITALLCVVAAERGPEMSPFDEQTHADYAWRVANLELPARGDAIAPEMLREWSCRGAAMVEVPPCGSERPAGEFPARGENYNFGHTPVYYVAVGLPARAADAVLPGRQFVRAARLLGIAWLLAGMLVLFVALRRFGTPAPYAFAGVAAVPLVPGVLHAASSVTNDAAAVLSGAAALLVLARILVDGRLGWAVPAGVTAAITATKVVSAMPMLAVACACAVMAWVAWRAGDRALAAARAKIAAGIAAAFVVVFQGWSALQSLRGEDGWVSPLAGRPERVVEGGPLDELLSTTFTGFQVVSSFHLPQAMSGLPVTMWGRALGMLAAAAPFLALVVFAPRAPRWIAGLLALGGLVAYPLVAEVQVYLQDDQYLPIVVGRYGMSFVPWVLACLAFVAAERQLRGVTRGLLGAGLAILLLASVT